MAGIIDDQGRILKKSGPLFQELSQNLPPGQYFSFTDKLDISYNNAKALLNQFNNDYARSVRDVLSSWENAADGYASKTKLMDALKQADIGAFCTIVDKHFVKAQKLEPFREGGAKPPGKNEEDRPPTVSQRGASNSIISSGSGNVTGNSMIGQQTNLHFSAPTKILKEHVPVMIAGPVPVPMTSIMPMKRKASAPDGVSSQTPRKKRKQKSSAKSNSAGAKGKATNPNQLGSKTTKKKGGAKKAGKSTKAKGEGRRTYQPGGQKIKKVQSAAKKPAAKKPAAKKSATKNPVAKKPAAKKPATKKPASKKPAAVRKPKAARKPAAAKRSTAARKPTQNRKRASKPKC